MHKLSQKQCVVCELDADKEKVIKTFEKYFCSESQASRSIDMNNTRCYDAWLIVEDAGRLHPKCCNILLGDHT